MRNLDQSCEHEHVLHSITTDLAKRVLFRRPLDRSNDLNPVTEYAPGAQHAIWLTRARLQRWRLQLGKKYVSGSGNVISIQTKRMRERIELQRLYAHYCLAQAKLARLVA